MENNYVKVLDHGFVGLVDHMGDDNSIVQAARVSYGAGTKTVNTDRNLIRYLMRHKHTTPFEMCEVKFHLKLPIFIMRQLVRHRTASINEYSGRYSVMSDEFYLPEKAQVCAQSTTNKQGRENELNDDQKLTIQNQTQAIFDDATKTYHGFIEDYDYSRELARTVLPVSNYTECYWKANLKNFFHMVGLRADSHAQWEIQEYANAMYNMVKPLFPEACQAWEDYHRDAVTFSGAEWHFIQEWIIGDMSKSDTFDEIIIDGTWDKLENKEDEKAQLRQAEKIICEEYNLSKREFTEMKNKIFNYA
jgi:thymidylate synthase (FAD)